MVPQKNSDKDHDFTLHPIEAYIDGDWVTAMVQPWALIMVWV